MKSTFLFVLLAVLLSIAGCDKPKPSEPQLPPITHEGKNILACKINGKVFIAEGTPTMLNNVGTSFGYYSDSSISIFGSNDETRNQIYIRFKYLSGKNLFILSDSFPGNKGQVEAAFNTSSNYIYKTDSYRTGFVDNLFYNGSILSGTFAFDAINIVGEIMHITEGRFDIGNK
jgi:hypothetical protein